MLGCTCLVLHLLHKQHCAQVRCANDSQVALHSVHAHAFRQVLLSSLEPDTSLKHAPLMLATIPVQAATS